MMLLYKLNCFVNSIIVLNLYFSYEFTVTLNQNSYIFWGISYAKEIEKQHNQIKDDTVAIIDAPLLFESGLNKMCDKIKLK